MPEQDAAVGQLAWLIAISCGVTHPAARLGRWSAQITRPGALPVDPFFFLIGADLRADDRLRGSRCGTSTRHRWLIDVQLACDALIVSAFIYVTGGITSYFSSLYALPIIAAASLQFRRGGMLRGAS